jgi:hypothetical protein
MVVGSCDGLATQSKPGTDALFAMRQAETIVKALKIGGYEIRKVSR